MEIEKPCPTIPQTNTIKEEVAPTLSMYDYNNSLMVQRNFRV